jgi:peptide/nickel transport system permease protein
MVILGLLSWPGLARLIRAQVLSVREQEYVVAARAVGVKKLGIVFRHILPNIISVILVSATLDFATCMLTEATLSYLGFGVPAPQPTWGNMLYGANSSIVIKNYWWRWVYASILLGICVISINVVGDGLRDAVDPKSQER